MSSSKLNLRLKPSVEQMVRQGHPWIFSDSIRDQSRDGAPGELAVVYDRNDRFLALGYFDPDSPIRVRVLHTGKPTQINDAWWTQRLEWARARREKEFNTATTGFRWIYGESDGFPALVLDRYGDTCVLKLYSRIWEDRVEWLRERLVQVFAPQRLVLRLSRNVQQAFAKKGFEDGGILHGEPLQAPVVFSENGLLFEADVIKGQKTGFFLDQRENRAKVESLARGRSVLNAFSFSGGFSLYAARGGARDVTDVDISEHALASSRRHFQMNAAQISSSCVHQTIKADVFEWLQEPSDQRRYDLVIIDPPALAKKKADRDAALRGYRKLARSGAEKTTKGGILICASCTAFVDESEFYDLVRSAVRAEGRTFCELQTSGHPVDHQASFAEARYLKAIFLKLD